MSIFDRFRLDGKRALVTASSRGIGRAIALAFADAGALVAVHGLDLEETRAVAAAVAERGGGEHAFAADFADPASVERLADDALSALGGIDILVSNAAVQFRRPWAELDSNEVESQIQINFKAALALIARLAPAMAERGWGRVLTVGSVQEMKPNPQMLVYAAMKAAQANAVGNLARQLSGRGVTVNNLAPGVILTDRSREPLADAAYARAVLERVPAGFFGEAEDCAGAALLLCSDAGRYVTGTTLNVTGGMHL